MVDCVNISYCTVAILFIQYNHYISGWFVMDKVKNWIKVQILSLCSSLLWYRISWWLTVVVTLRKPLCLEESKTGRTRSDLNWCCRYNTLDTSSEVCVGRWRQLQNCNHGVVLFCFSGGASSVWHPWLWRQDCWSVKERWSPQSFLLHRSRPG